MILNLLSIILFYKILETKKEFYTNNSIYFFDEDVQINWENIPIPITNSQHLTEFEVDTTKQINLLKLWHIDFISGFGQRNYIYSVGKLCTYGSEIKFNSLDENVEFDFENNNYIVVPRKIEYLYFNDSVDFYVNLKKNIKEYVNVIPMKILSLIEVLIEFERDFKCLEEYEINFPISGYFLLNMLKIEKSNDKFKLIEMIKVFKSLTKPLKKHNLVNELGSKIMNKDNLIDYKIDNANNYYQFLLYFFIINSLK